MSGRTIRLPADDAIVISVPTTRWAMEQIQALAASGRYPTSFSACADEILRAALREIERAALSSKSGPGRGSAAEERE